MEENNRFPFLADYQAMGGGQIPFEQDWLNWSHFHNYGPVDGIISPDMENYHAWARQMVSTMYQNWYNSEPEKMQRMMKAGINPYLASQGIAGAGGSSGSVASPPPTPSSSSRSIETLGNVGGSLLGGIANTANAVVGAIDTLSTLSHRINETDSHAAQLLANAGYDEAATAGIMTNNKYLDENWVAELNIKRQNYDNMKQQFGLIQYQKDYIQKQLDWYDEQIQSTIDLQESQKLLNEKQKFYYENMGLAQKMENEYFEKFWSHSSDPTEVALKNMFLKSVESGDDSVFHNAYDALMSYLYDKAYKQYRGQYDSDTDTLFERMRNAAIGTDEGRKLNAKYFAKIENYKELFSDLARLYTSGDGNIESIVHRLMGSIGAVLQIPPDVINQMFREAFNSGPSE